MASKHSRDTVAGADDDSRPGEILTAVADDTEKLLLPQAQLRGVIVRPAKRLLSRKILSKHHGFHETVDRQKKASQATEAQRSRAKRIFHLSFPIIFHFPVAILGQAGR
jgi:hypothetical protein